jgi:dipeptidase E
MKFLLTSGGIANDSIHKALVDLLGKPIAEARALCILTAAYAVPDGPALAWLNAREWGEMGWKAFGILEPTAFAGVLAPSARSS